VITAVNKIDLISEEEAKEKLEALGDKIVNPVLISALCRTNFETLKEEILKRFESPVQATFSVPQTKEAMSFLSWVYDAANVKKTDYLSDCVQVVFEANSSIADDIRRRVAALKGTFQTTSAVSSVQQE
jgi:50S ribosomal subunit-associated GTPase HflX